MSKKAETAGEAMIEALQEAADFIAGEPMPNVVVHHGLDVGQVRAKTGLSQARFAQRFGFSVATLRDWEQGRRVPDRAAQILLRIIDSEPEAVDRALRAEATSP